jgi:hypothetical protein
MTATTAGSAQVILPTGHGATPAPAAEPGKSREESAPDLFQEIEPTRAADAAAPGDAVIKEEPTTLDQLHRFAKGGFLFALLDSTDQILVPYKAKLLGPSKAISLFSGTAKEQYWAIAPYLFQVDAEILEWLVAELWKEPWGIFALSKSNFEELRLHFKKFLLVQLPDGKVWFFRYYDPRILKTYLPVCQPWELQKFFGPVRAFATGGGKEEKPPVLQSAGRLASSSPPSQQEGMYWRIRPEQHKEFDLTAEKSFVDRCIKFLQEKLPAQSNSLPPKILRERVEAGITHARSYGVTWQSSLLMFVTLMFEIGPNFDRHSSIQPLLRDKSRRPDVRIKHIVNNVSSEDWKRVSEQTNQSFWDTLVRSTTRAR